MLQKVPVLNYGGSRISVPGSDLPQAAHDLITVGGYVYAFDGVALGGKRRYSNRHLLAKESKYKPLTDGGNAVLTVSDTVLLADSGGKYILVNTKSGVGSGHGIFKHWPTDFIAGLSWCDVCVAYNTTHAVVLVCENAYDSDWNEIGNYTCYDLTKADTVLFTVTAGQIGQYYGFYLTVSDSGSVQFGGIYSRDIWSNGNNISQIAVHNCTDGVLIEQTTDATTIIGGQENTLLEPCVSDLESKRIVVNQSYSATMTEDFELMTVASPQPTYWSLEMTAAPTVNATLSIGALQNSASYVNGIVDGNPKTGEYIGKIEVSGMKTLSIHSQITAIVSTAYSVTMLNNDITSGPYATDTCYFIPSLTNGTKNLVYSYLSNVVGGTVQYYTRARSLTWNCSAYEQYYLEQIGLGSIGMTSLSLVSKTESISGQEIGYPSGITASASSNNLFDARIAPGTYDNSLIQMVVTENLTWGDISYDLNNVITTPGADQTFTTAYGTENFPIISKVTTDSIYNAKSYLGEDEIPCGGVGFAAIEHTVDSSAVFLAIAGGKLYTKVSGASLTTIDITGETLSGVNVTTQIAVVSSSDILALI